MNKHTNGHSSSGLLPSAKPFNVSDELAIQPPLSRRGHGPGLLILVPRGLDLNSSARTLDPPPLQKWAEEGWAVAQITVSDGSSGETLGKQIQGGLKALSELKECDSIEKVGVISYNAPLSQEAREELDATSGVVAVVIFGGDSTIIPPSSSTTTSRPVLHHHATGQTPSKAATPSSKNVTTYSYESTGAFFTIPTHADFRPAAAAVAHTRTLSFLKPLTGGPRFDIEAVWEEHTLFEFGERDVGKTMATMVQEPYVNHIPTLTGGIGRERLTDFYTHHFVFNNPDDTDLELVSRTVGVDRVIDEFNFRFTHDRVIDWLLPGVPPTGKYVEVPFTSIVNVRGDRLYHEHIGWDQATLLRQLGLMPEYLPFPYPLPDGRKPGPGKRFEYRVPTAGIDTASKLRDESAVESNGMFDFEIREVDI